ncbi:MAG: BON domain-containing protein [Solirubrobacterales bacterium]|nr:BON domain-containing protein [Solirubrobacterales bacterium]
MSYDVKIEDDVRGALARDRRIPSPDEVAISSVDGTVVLRGTVGSFSQRYAAVSDARHVEGVYDVEDHLQVRILDADRRADADIRGAALEALHRDTEVPEGLVDVNVSDGWLTLTGEVGWQDQSNAAYYDVANLQGVTGITNEIKVITP